MVIKKIIYLNILFCFTFPFFANGFIHYENKPSTNYEVIYKTYTRITSKIISDLPAKDGLFFIQIEGDSNKWIFEAAFAEQISSGKYSVADKPDSNVTSVKIFNETKIRYSKFNEDDDLFVRNIFCLSNVTINSKSANQKNYTETFSDTININDIGYINSAKIQITTNSYEEKSFFYTVLEPLIILSSSGLLVYLLFTVRSK